MSKLATSRDKLLLELLDMIGRKDKKMYRYYCGYILDYIQNDEIGCTKKILREILPNEKKLDFPSLKRIFFPDKPYKTIQELISEALKLTKKQNKQYFPMLEIGVFTINFMLHLEKKRKIKQQKGPSI